MITDKIIRDLSNTELETIKLKERLKSRYLSTKSCYGTRVHINQKISSKKAKAFWEKYTYNNLAQLNE